LNYLAHAYLSFNQPEVLVGNLISDFVKGKQQYRFPPGVQIGIQLHRWIDAFTDTHAATKQLKNFFKPYAGPYAPAFADVAYDYCLANDANCFSEGGLQAFALNTYAILVTQKALLPPKFAEMLPSMQKQNWLFNYQYLWGMEKSFGGIVRRASYLEDATPAFKAFAANLPIVQNSYNQMFPQLFEQAKQKLEQLLNT
jgi:acyl carrier protein phosphodiesterase